MCSLGLRPPWCTCALPPCTPSSTLPPHLGNVLEFCRYLEGLPAEERGCLWGIPFAVKDNIDVAGFPTTCACPDFAFTPEKHAPTVQTLLDAGGQQRVGAGCSFVAA